MQVTLAAALTPIHYLPMAMLWIQKKWCGQNSGINYYSKKKGS